MTFITFLWYHELYGTNYIYIVVFLDFLSLRCTYKALLPTWKHNMHLWILIVANIWFICLSGYLYISFYFSFIIECKVHSYETPYLYRGEIVYSMLCQVFQLWIYYYITGNNNWRTNLLTLFDNVFPNIKLNKTPVYLWLHFPHQ